MAFLVIHKSKEAPKNLVVVMERETWGMFHFKGEATNEEEVNNYLEGNIKFPKPNGKKVDVYIAKSHIEKMKAIKKVQHREIFK